MFFDGPKVGITIVWAFIVTGGIKRTKETLDTQKEAWKDMKEYLEKKCKIQVVVYLNDNPDSLIFISNQLIVNDTECCCVYRASWVQF